MTGLRSPVKMRNIAIKLSSSNGNVTIPKQGRLSLHPTGLTPTRKNWGPRCRSCLRVQVSETQNPPLVDRPAKNHLDGIPLIVKVKLIRLSIIGCRFCVYSGAPRLQHHYRHACSLKSFENIRFESNKNVQISLILPASSSS